MAGMSVKANLGKYVLATVKMFVIIWTAVKLIL